MGAIGGIINLNNKMNYKNSLYTMMDKLSICKLDKIDFIEDKNLFMICGLNYITPESLNENLPLVDNKKNLMITCDAIIDNRKELLEIFNIDKNMWGKITDTDLILLSYEKWGNDCPKYLVGDFAFVIYDKNLNRIFCARDHVGKRTLYYSLDSGNFIFCTLMNPILATLDKKVELNERWTTDFLALWGVHHQTEAEETIYNQIYQVPPGSTLEVDNIDTKVRKYWNPLNDVKPLKLSSEKEYIEKFLEIYTEAVNCRLRSCKEVGVLLSGGLDSGSVACLAARELEKKHKRLKAFSFIPATGYIDDTPRYQIADEREYIEEILKIHKNIDETYMNCDGKDAVSDIEDFISTFEQPYKIVENINWINESCKIASEQGVSILLDGQYGNSTISFGDFFIHAKTLFKEGKLIKLSKEIDKASKYHNFPKKKLIKDTMEYILPDKINNYIHREEIKKKDRFNECPIKKELVKKWDVEKRFENLEFNSVSIHNHDLNSIRMKMIDDSVFSHVGEIETKLSLKYGVIKRDPTRDKRIIEFCLSLPTEMFVDGGMERALVRKSMKGILPEKIRLNSSVRGKQSADWIYRITPKWKQIKKELENMLNNDESIISYIDIDKLKNTLEILDIDNLNEHKNEVRMLLVTLVFSKFLQLFEDKYYLLGGMYYGKKTME